ncbi:MAG: acetate--CoA ligase family protein [Bacteroidales bacterium]|nr:acetate--CoA ligase family protein [Bacteroidales bacterium]
MIRIPATTQQNLIMSGGEAAVNPPIDKETIDEVLQGSTSAVLDKEQSLRLLDAIGISRERTLIVNTIDEARVAATDIGFPINMENITLYEGDEKQVIENITDKNTMRLEFDRLMRAPGAKGVLIRPSLFGAGFYFGIRYRAALGHLVVCGTVTSPERKPSGFVCSTLPVTKTEASAILSRVRGSQQINEYIFSDTLRRLSALCSYAPQIEKMDIFPVVVNARSVVALDANVALRQSI